MIIGIILLTSCIYQNGQIIIRIPFAELQSGGYYGGNLIYHPEDPLISHIGKGTLIAFQDITFGWEEEGDDEYCPVAINKNYGYLYIKEIDVTEIIYDYLIYNDTGDIIETGDGVSLQLLLGAPDYSCEQRDNVFSGIRYFEDVNNFGESLKGTYLLNFRHDNPEENENGEIPLQETYRRVIFRIQGDPESPYEYEKGIIAASLFAPHSIVVNSAYHSEYTEHGEATETAIAFYNTLNLPTFNTGDFILDARFGIVRKVVSVDDSHPSYTLLQTELSNMDVAVGTVSVTMEGDLEEIINRYGSRSDRQIIQRAIEARKQFNLYEKEWDINILDRDDVKVTLENKFSLDVKASIHFHLSWKELSSHGSISFPMDFSSVLAIEALLGFEKGDTKELADPGITFSVCGVPIKIDVPISFIYELKAELAEFDFEFGPELGLELGFKYDVGAKIKFKWKVIPVGIKTWHSASGIFKISKGFVGPNVTFSDRPELTSTIGLQFEPGITIACVIRPQLTMPFELIGDLRFRSSGLELILQFQTTGDLEIKIGVSFINKTFHLGRVFHYLQHIGDWHF
jgi:hypothetical protein